ncbi:MAG: radical SAM protein [Desulfamplus sp.]|nr:radical SAM protein [Desulfamplus sp.]
MIKKTGLMEIINISSARWQTQLKNVIHTLSQLSDSLNCSTSNYITTHTPDIDASALKNSINKDILEKVIEKYPMRITPYYLSLIRSVGDAIWKQAVPDVSELLDTVNIDDPLHEEPQSPVPSIIHRYPDRVIFLVSNICAMYCRHCMRKRKVGINNTLSPINRVDKSTQTHFPDHLSYSHNINNYDELDWTDKKKNYISQGLSYIGQNKNIRDVILSGGDPLMLSTEDLDRILFSIRQFDHVETIRIHTRVLCTLPFRITENLASVLEKYHPLYINTHFNHPAEITDEAATACSMLARAGIPLGCQTVLLRGVNDTPEIMTDLMRTLIKIRVKPYYLHHPDAVEGTAHFRPSLKVGLGIMKALRGSLTGIAIPQYMIDLPGGYGKVPMLPDYIKSKDDNKAVVENYQGKTCEYIF